MHILLGPGAGTICRWNKVWSEASEMETLTVLSREPSSVLWRQHCPNTQQNSFIEMFCRIRADLQNNYAVCLQSIIIRMLQILLSFGVFPFYFCGHSESEKLFFPPSLPPLFPPFHPSFFLSSLHPFFRSALEGLEPWICGLSDIKAYIIRACTFLIFFFDLFCYLWSLTEPAQPNSVFSGGRPI